MRIFFIRAKTCKKANFKLYFPSTNRQIITRGRAVAARQAHNLEVAGSNPAPATRVKTQS